MLKKTDNARCKQFGWEPADGKITFDLRLPDGAFRLYIAISFHIDRSSGYCYASNQFFADKLGCGLSAIKERLKYLRQAGYIEITTRTTKDRNTGEIRTLRRTREGWKTSGKQ